VVGFDLAGPERDHLASEHAAAFERARSGNLWVTCHAGEDAGPESIADAIRECAVDRIGHGVALVRDPALLTYVADHGIGIEACLTSNLQTGAVASLEAHPLPQLLAAGVRVSLATDNRLVSHTTVTREYQHAIATFGLDRRAIAGLARNGIESAFLSRARRATLLAELDAALAVDT
jgi:adenosine deaminase